MATNLSPQDGAVEDDKDAYIASLLDELNALRREKETLLQKNQANVTPLHEKTRWEDEDDAQQQPPPDDDSVEQAEKGAPPPQRTHLYGLNRELADTVGTDTVATYRNYLNARRSLMLRRRSSVASSLSLMHRSRREIEVLQNVAKRTNSVVWDEISKDLDILDEDEHTRNDHKTMTPFYSPPVQRQRYGDEKVLPHEGWGDLFFDLFYVAAAFNLTVLLKSALVLGRIVDIRVYLYFFGSLGPLWSCWETETMYQSRYLTIDYSHRVAEVLRYIFVAGAIFNITPFEAYYDPRNANIVIYTLAMVLEQMMQLALRIELYYKGLGDELAIKSHTLLTIKYRKIPVLSLYIVAFITATITYVNAIRNVTGERGSWDLNDLPLTITTVVYFLELLYEFTWYLTQRHKDVRTYFVPVNVEFLIKRYGEFIMLMLGEDILALIGMAETNTNPKYYQIVILGIILVIWLHFLKFESEPSNSLEHALWGNRWNTVCFILLIHVISVSLIGLGTSFKVFISDSGQDNGYDAGSTFFVIFLSVTIVSLELLNLCHTGFKRAVGHLFKSNKGQKAKLYWPVFILSLIKLGIFLFCMTLNKWTIEPVYLLTAGCSVVIALSTTRVMIYFFVHQKALIQTAAKTAKENIRKVRESVIEIVRNNNAN